MSTRDEPPVSFRLSAEHDRLLRAAAAELSLSRNQYARLLVIQGLQGAKTLGNILEQVTAMTSAMGELGEYLEVFREEFRRAVEDAKGGEG